MPQTNLQLGGGYTYQWECAVLLALNYLLDDTPLEYNAELHQLIDEFLGQVQAIQLEGETRDQDDIELEDVNLLGINTGVHIQVKAKEAEAKWWIPSDPLLTKALYRFYCSKVLDRDEPSVQFVFLTNQTFNQDLVVLKAAMSAGTVAGSKPAFHLFNQVQKYVIKTHPEADSLDSTRFNQLLGHLQLIRFLPIDAVAAIIQGKLQSLGIEAWEQAYEHLYTRFSKGSVRTGGTRITRADLVASLEQFSKERFRLRVPPLALHQLPPDIADFTGRKERLARVVSLLEQASEVGRTAVVISAVAGMAGVGKSALAVHAAHQLKDRFPDAQLYVDLRGADDQPLDPLDTLAMLLRSLGLENQFIPEDLQERTALYRSRMTDKRALVLLDNAFNENQVRPLLPGHPACAILVTSRKRLSALEGAVVVDLQRMPEEEALELLACLAGAERVKAEQDTARRIVTLCDRLPLAIRIAGAKLSDRPHWSLAGYASQLEDEERRPELLELDNLSVRASFALSSQDLTPRNARFFRLLGLLPAARFSLQVATRLLDIEPAEALDALERLTSLQLLEPAGESHYRIHDLMHLFAKEQLDEREPVEEQKAARSRLERWYLEAPDVHFYAQAEILDGYIHSSNPEADPEMLEAILTVLQMREDLRRYFFRRGPSAAWAPILYEHSFFEQPPSPQKTEQGYVLPSWDILYYLNSVAPQVADVVVQVAESFEGAGWYTSLIVQALKAIPAERSVKLLPRIIAWLDEPSIAAAIADETAGLVAHLAQGEQLDAALDLMKALTAPVPASEAKTVDHMVFGAEARSKFLTVHDYEADQFFDQLIPQLATVAPERVVTTLQEHLCTALRLEEEALGEPLFEQWSWRAAIEDTGQDLDDGYRDRLLRALRDTLEIWVQADAQTAEPVIGSYLRHKVRILRRLGSYILGRFPARYRELVTEQLQELENLDDTGIHHEFFTLMRTGFPLLDDSDRERLVAAICNGPTPERVRELANWAKENKGITDIEEYSRRHVQNWVRERLWMLQDYLSGKPAEVLQKLNEELGPPQIPPGFTRWSSGGFVGHEVSPKPKAELAAMSPEELVRYIEEWQPEPRQSFDPEWITYGGLAREIANVILEAPEEYEQHTARIALYRPEFAYALLRHIRDDKPETPDAWEFAIQLCETVLQDPVARTDMTRVLDGSWVEVRRTILHLIELGINNEQHRPPDDLWPRVRDILLTLLDDPDPDEETDHPPEGHFEHEDPATVAINAVRPRALLSLVEYAELRARLAEEERIPSSTGPGPKRLELVVREALTRKLDRQKDPSWAVHSAYGRHLFRLSWLDREWTEDYIDEIFPTGEDENSIRYYTAAWDSYVSYHRYWHPDLELLRPKYERAIHNLGEGHVTKMQGGMSPEAGLAVHVAGEYLRSDYDLRSPAGPHNLLALLYQEATQAACNGISWFFWRVFEEDPQHRESYWPRVRIVWEMRSEQASAADHSTGFDTEMKWFAHLLPFVPESETLASLWPLLKALVPHITRSKYRTREWDAVEEYLASQVDRDPVRAIRLYHQMHEQRPPFEFYRASDEAHKIIETAASDKKTCRDALALINFLARHNNHEFRDVYERHKDCLAGEKV